MFGDVTYWPVVEQQEIPTEYAAKSEEKKDPFNKVPSNPQIRKPPISLKPQWQTSVAHASLSQYKNELQRAVSYVLKQANSGDEGWEYVITKNDVQILRQRNPDNQSFIIVKGRGTVEAPPRKILQAIVGSPRAGWDSLCKESRVVETFDEGTKIFRDVYEAQQCLIKVPRDFVYIWRWYETDNDGYIITAASVSHESEPEYDGIVRGHMWPSGWIIEPLKKGGDSSSEVDITQITVILQIDLKAAFVPSAILDTILIGQPMKIAKLRQLIGNNFRKVDFERNLKKTQEEKFSELSSFFGDDEQLISFLLHKCMQRNAELTRKYIHSLNLLSSPPASDPKLETTRARTSSLLHQIKCGAYSTKGDRDSLEDEYYMCKGGPDDNPFVFFSIFDGHSGSAAAKFCKEHFYSEFEASVKIVNNDVQKALRIAFQNVETKFIEEALKKNVEAGTTAVIAVVYSNKLVISNVGDSEALLCQNSKPIVLSERHSPRNPDEVSRVKESGGSIQLNRRLCHPVWNPELISLGITRSIGDVYFKHAKFTDGKVTGLVAEPHIKQIELTSADQFILLACDGLWDVVSYQEACAFITKHLKEKKGVTEICKALAEYALVKGSRDNITVILASF